MALRANDADGYKSWLELGIEQLGRDVAGEGESDWMVPLLVEEERDRLTGWQLGERSVRDCPSGFFEQLERIS